MKARFLHVGLSWAAGLGLTWAQVVVAANTSPGSWAASGAGTAPRGTFADVVVVTNPPATFTNPARQGTLVEPRLVTNYSRGRYETAPASAKPMAAAASQSMNALDSKQKLHVGDRLSFRVLEDQEESKPLTVTDAGDLDVPELGLVAAVGKTCKQLAYEIKGKLEQTTYYQATVVLNISILGPGASGRRVYVTGCVQRTGLQEIPAGESWTVAKAILRAGGFTQYADPAKVKLLRNGQNGAPGSMVIVNVGEVLSKGRMEKDRAVEAEDVILVPERGVLY